MVTNADCLISADLLRFLSSTVSSTQKQKLAGQPEGQGGDDGGFYLATRQDLPPADLGGFPFDGFEWVDAYGPRRPLTETSPGTCGAYVFVCLYTCVCVYMYIYIYILC